jgi:hypothetical protein
MAIEIKIGDAAEAEVETTEEKPKPIQAKLKLKARRTLDGHIVIFDHNDIDIVVMPDKSKILTFPKDTMGDHVYDAQDRFFHFLTQRGVIEADSIQGGNIYSSLEANIATSDDHNSLQMAVFAIGKFIEEERPYIDYEEKFKEEEEKRLTEPAEDESTEFDPDKYHAQEKGSIKTGLRPYGLSGLYSNAYRF